MPGKPCRMSFNTLAEFPSHADTHQSLYKVQNHRGAAAETPGSLLEDSDVPLLPAGAETIDTIKSRRCIDRYCLLALVSRVAAILERSPAPLSRRLGMTDFKSTIQIPDLALPASTWRVGVWRKGYSCPGAIKSSSCRTGNTQQPLTCSSNSSSNQQTGNMMSKIVFYEERNFQGRSYECSSDCPDMSSYMSRCHSCRVEKGCFMVYDRTNFMGNQYFMRRGEYADYMSMMGMSDCIKSCRMIPMHRGSYRMKIYERENFDGQMHELMDDCDNIMSRYSMSNCMSCNTMDGHWLMYEQPCYRGRMMYMRPGEYRNFMNMGMNNMKFMSMRRIMDSYY
ncbi:gamma-crystallin M2-like [Scomber scombrus]|uniref:gamma-crystallin M2-like n=1 Tax=Scomber scombrus TaxID=13677 RepID=UPI002DD92ADD|nr:gamma-crystallin M2-like [Scomber scombrus]